MGLRGGAGKKRVTYMVIVVAVTVLGGLPASGTRARDINISM